MAMDLAVNAAGKLEPFTLLAKSARGRAAAKLVEDATAAPGVFLFSELLEMPNIQDLGKSDQSSYFALLQLFAYGTYEDYLRRKNALPPLNPAHIKKLKLLTLVSLALEHRVLPYALLLQSLQISNIRELEDLIIDGVYLDLLRGKLDQKAQQFEVEYAIGRDLEPEKVEGLLSALRDWAKTTSSVLSSLDSQLESLASQRAASAALLDEHERAVQANLAQVHESIKESKAGRKPLSAANIAQDPMDIDDPQLLSSGADYSKGKKSGLRENVKHQIRKRNKF